MHSVALDLLQGVFGDRVAHVQKGDKILGMIQSLKNPINERLAHSLSDMMRDIIDCLRRLA